MFVVAWFTPLFVAFDVFLKNIYMCVCLCCFCLFPLFFWLFVFCSVCFLFGCFIWFALVWRCVIIYLIWLCLSLGFSFFKHNVFLLLFFVVSLLLFLHAWSQAVRARIVFCAYVSCCVFMVFFAFGRLMVLFWDYYVLLDVIMIKLILLVYSSAVFDIMRVLILFSKCW